MMTREELQAALDLYDNVNVPEDELFLRYSEAGYPWSLFVAAARSQLALMPEKCGTCDGEGHYVVASTRGQYETDDITCPTCHGSGKVYPPETVEKIEWAVGLALVESGLEVNGRWSKKKSRRFAVAVLDALGETE